VNPVYEAREYVVHWSGPVYLRSITFTGFRPPHRSIRYFLARSPPRAAGRLIQPWVRVAVHRRSGQLTQHGGSVVNILSECVL
jgi:hypothetical protein